VPEKLPAPQDVREVVEFIREHRSVSDRFDVANIGWTTGVNRERDAEKVGKYVDAGITWWLESLYTTRDSPEAMRSRIGNGPPNSPAD
jgi:hypothetical protein